MARSLTALLVTAHLDTNKIAFQKIIIKRGKSALNGYGFISFKRRNMAGQARKAGWSGHLTSSNIELQDINLINKRCASSKGEVSHLI